MLSSSWRDCWAAVRDTILPFFRSMPCDGSLGHVSSPLNLSRLNRIVLLYGHLAGPWLCAAVYL